MHRPAGNDILNDDAFSLSMFRSTRIERELAPREALKAVSLRMHHVVDESPQRNVIFEVDSDISEDVLVQVIQKLSSKFDHISVITAEDELLHLVVGRLRKDLEPTSVEEKGGATEMKATWSHYRKSHDYSLSIGRMSHFVGSEFEGDVREERAENRVVVLYRTETLLDGRGVLEPLDVDTVDRQVTPLLCHIYRMVDVLDEHEVLRRLRDYIKRYTDRFLSRFLADRIGDLARSARAAKGLVEGTHYGFLRRDGKSSLIVASSTAREHPAILQFLQIHHSLPVTPLRIPALRRSPLMMIKGFGRVFGVFRRGGYDLRQWLPFLTQFPIHPARVYPHDAPVTPIFAMPASVTISEWIVQVEELMQARRKIPQRGARLIVCPSTAAMNQLWRYLKYSHDVMVSQTPMVVCAGTADQLEQTMAVRDGAHLVTVLTTATHFETWHTRYLCTMDVVTVFLGTSSRELPYLHRAYRFARPVTNVVTVPFETAADRSPNDSGFDSDSASSNGRGSGGDLQQLQQSMLAAQALATVPNRSHWATIFMKEMWGRSDWKAKLACPEDDEYDKCVQWMRRRWTEMTDQPNVDFDEWRGMMLEKYREETKE